MQSRIVPVIVFLCGVGFGVAWVDAAAGSKEDEPDTQPAKVYVPYKELKGVFEKTPQGVFLPYEQFERLWRAAQARPDEMLKAPFDYLISSARFSGSVKDELARLRLELTIDVLAEDWVQVPIGLAEVGVSKAEIVEPKEGDIRP
ncbi:MAG: hypothetical protein ACYS29_16965, partial [Planctomycetota bacterium]